jgi:iron complex outermembrane receptor protein
MSSAAFAEAADAESSVSEVIVTGTRTIGLKAADSPAPVQVLGESALKRVGQADLIQALAQNLPSFTAEATGGDTGNLTLAAALRGLNPNDTLVLVNGKRRHTTGNLHVLGGPYQGAATADLSLIPVAAIDHIEILQDGAAAQYGTDAIAGVVNIILKSARSGGSISGTVGQYYKGDGESAAWSLNLGAPLGSKGFVNVTLEERYHDFSVRGGPDRRVQNLNGTVKASANAIDRAGLPGAKNFPVVNMINGDAAYNIYTGYLNAGYDISDDLHAYATASYSNRVAEAYENYRVPSKVTRPGPGGTTIVPFPNGFDPKEYLDEEDFSVGGGLRGTTNGWEWDLASTYGRDKDLISTINSANASLFADTGVTPRNFYDGAFIASQWTNNLDVSKTFDVGMASPLTFAFGAEYRKETYEIKPGDPLSIYKEGGQSYPGFQPTDAGKHSRTNYGAYVDFAADVVENLKVDLAGRYEHYSDFGSATVGKLTARYDFTPMVAVRGTISTGFRAPTLAEEFYSATNVAPTFAVVQLPANSAAAAQIGFNKLKPEKSVNFSGGFVLHPAERLQITADAYQIEIKRRIIPTGTLLGLVGTTVVSQNVLNAIRAHGNVLDPTGLSYVGVSVFTNAAKTRTRGLEVTANYASDFGEMGHVDWSAALNYNKTKVLSQAPLPAQVRSTAFGQTAILSPTALSYLTTAPPRVKVVFGAFWSLDKWSVNLRETVYGKSSEIVSLDGTGNGGTVERIGTTGITDLDIGFQVTPSLKFNVGANNLLNHKTPTVPNIPNGSGGVRPADGSNVYNAPLGFSPFGINGGYYYARATYTF